MFLLTEKRMTIQPCDDLSHFSSLGSTWIQIGILISFYLVIFFHLLRLKIHILVTRRINQMKNV